jgi:hypothetical protein
VALTKKWRVDAPRKIVRNPAQRLEADLLSFPGMSVDETVVWRAWAALHQTEYDRFEHNIRLGPARDPGPGYSVEVRKGEMLNSQMRIDSVGYQDIQPDLLPLVVNSPQDVYDVFPSAVVTIFEVKRRATLAAIGEILGYFAAWIEEWPNNPTPRMMLICTEYSSTILPGVKVHNIALDVVTANFSILSNAHGT